MAFVMHQKIIEEYLLVATALLIDRSVERGRGLSLFLARGKASSSDAVRSVPKYIKFTVIILEIETIIQNTFYLSNIMPDYSTVQGEVHFDWCKVVEGWHFWRTLLLSLICRTYHLWDSVSKRGKLLKNAIFYNFSFFFCFYLENGGHFFEKSEIST